MAKPKRPVATVVTIFVNEQISLRGKFVDCFRNRREELLQILHVKTGITVWHTNAILT
jgi:hypothetical protein